MDSPLPIVRRLDNINGSREAEDDVQTCEAAFEQEAGRTRPAAGANFSMRIPQQLEKTLDTSGRLVLSFVSRLLSV